MNEYDVTFDVRLNRYDHPKGTLYVVWSMHSGETFPPLVTGEQNVSESLGLNPVEFQNVLRRAIELNAAQI